MGFFSEIVSETRRGMAHEQAAPFVPQKAVPSLAASEPEPAPSAAAPEPEAVPSASVEPEQEPTAVMAPPEQRPDPPSIDLTPEANAEDETKRKRDHEAAEAKRKAEFDAKQAEKKKARQEQLDKIKAMSDAELLAASVGRVAADTERLTRRNMKEAVAEHIQEKCKGDAAFARLVMDPDKSMINCFQYINRRAR